MKQSGNIARCLVELGYAVVPIEGTSMWPLLQERKALVELVAAEEKLFKKGDVVLYCKEDGTLVLHRIIRVGKECIFSVLGDHQIHHPEQVRQEQILAVARGFFRNGCYVDEKTRWYRIYKKIWSCLTLRRCCLVFLRLSGIEKRALAGKASD